MNLSFLPNEIYSAINKIDIDKLNEIKLRENFPVIVVVNGKEIVLENENLSGDKIICLKSDIDYIIKKVTEYSLYAHNERLKNGFLTTEDGIRIGVAGDCVCENQSIITIKNITSLIIRIPNSIKSDISSVWQKIYSENIILNTLIISPPFFGKTTMLKSLALKINELTGQSLLIIDERGEFFNINGLRIDKIRFSSKEYALNCGIRSLAPTVTMTDEIMTKEDWKAINHACDCGVKIIASIHAKDINEVIAKDFFVKNIFQRYVILSDKNVGQVKEILDGDYIKL